MSQHDIENLAEIRRIDRLAAVEYIGEIPEQPRAAQTISSTRLAN
jgi:hypothetical protein